MLNLAFWNLNKKDSSKEVTDFIRLVTGSLVSGAPSDTIVGFAESNGIDWPKVLSDLGSNWHIMSSARGRFTIATNIYKGQFIKISEKGRSYFIGVARPSSIGLHNIVLCFVHFESPFGKWYKDSNAQSEALKIRNRIVEIEESWSLPDTVVLGDLNMDPYEPAMTNGRGLNAAMCRNVARQMTRTFGPKDDEETVRFFYNPMWRALGDRTSTNQPGSYYNSKDKSDAVVWHCIDQVLVRPSLIDHIVDGTPSVITEIGTIRLLSRGGLPKKMISDHLPIFVSLDL